MPQDHPTDRRQFLAALAASALLPAGAALAQPRPFRIDVHHHYFAPAMLAAQIAARAEGLSPEVRAWTPGKTLEAMDANSVAAAIVSTSSNAELRKSLGEDGMRRMARINNEYAARLAADHNGRFGFFAFLPLPDVEGSLDEMQLALDALKADGVGLMTSYDGKWLGDEAFVPVLQELNRRKAKVFVHPLAPLCCGNLVPKVANSVLEYPYDSGRAVLSLLFNGRFVQYRDIDWIFCHAGGPIPMLAGRIATQNKNNKDLAAVAPKGIEAELQRLYYETANSAYPPTMAALMKFVPATQVLFGSDFPYVGVDDNVGRITKLGIPAAQMTAIERLNALKLFPRLKPGG
jgi:6-methylsalicylate decarboxylase